MPSTTVGPQPISDQVIQEKLSAFDSVPLFMKTLPTEDTDDAIISALQNLAHDGTPDEIAQNFKEQGNDYFKGKRYREALGFYTQGIDAKPTENGILEALFCNRAACNLELSELRDPPKDMEIEGKIKENFGSVLRDCSKALGLNPRSSKAFYRSALALIALDRVEEAIDCCFRCLDFDSDNKSVKDALERANKSKAHREKKENERLERIRKESEAKQLLYAAFRVRNLIPIHKPDGSENSYSPQFDTEDPTGNTLLVPVFFLYPQYATTDIITHFIEDTAFAAHISTMFPPQAPPPEWDSNGEYVDGHLVVYAMTRRKRLLKIGRNMTLRDVCKAAGSKDGQPKDGLELKDGCLTFVVLPKGDVEKKWVEEYKKTRNE